MFGRTKISDPYNTMGNPGKPSPPKGAPAPPARQSAASKERIRRYGKAVAANKAAGAPVSDGTAYRSLTRSDCALLWGPGCPEANDRSRRP